MGGNGQHFARLMGGYTLVFENSRAVESGAEKELRFAAFASDGSEAGLQPYMGMRGHAALRREDGSVFAHLHPSGSFSMASQQLFQQRLAGADFAEVKPAKAPPGNQVSFPYEFPAAGKYRLWIQVRIAGRVLTGVYDLNYSGVTELSGMPPKKSGRDLPVQASGLAELGTKLFPEGGEPFVRVLHPPGPWP